MMHSLEVVVPCQGLISGLLMTPGGSELVRSLGPRTRPEVRGLHRARELLWSQWG